MSNVSAWTTSAAGNQDSPPNGFPEGQSPSSLNDASREVMAAVARWYRDNQGSLTSTGINNTYAVTSNSGYTALTDLPPVVFIANHENTGPATLDVDGLGAKPIHSNGAALGSGQIVENVVYSFVYNATDDAYDMLGGPSNDASNLTQGTLPDARLSNNIPRKDQANTFTADGFAASTAPINLESSGPWLRYADPGQASDEKVWLAGVQTGRYRILTRTDADGNGDVLLSATRTGTNIDSLALSADTITLNGVDVSNYARTDAPNTFEAFQTISAGTPILQLSETDTNADWRIRVTGETFRLSRQDGGAVDAFIASGDGAGNITSFRFINGTVEFDNRPQSTGGGGVWSHASSSNTGGSVTVSNTLAGSAGAVGGPGDIRLVY